MHASGDAPVNRRDFITKTAYSVGVAWLTSQTLAFSSLPQKYSAADTVVLGKTGFKNIRLAMGTGYVSTESHSHHASLGVKGLSDLLLNGYDHALRFFDAADAYGIHPHVAAALK